ncbi:MAG: MFS transporter [Gammaproteobacteria bacterium]|nr:MFS transporter [Gammaproteobacteria bacterium]MDH3768198.1 MFS transporter [Gammaproteobacteria bacterium]
MKQKPQLSFWQIWNMTFGFLGIQFGWGLQMGNMSAIYEFLGAAPDEIPLLWLAAPMTGLIVQPIIGMLSDRTWHPTFGRRRPYFLIGAILASLTLVAMPHASAIWMAAGMLWILDASINISMEPTRAFVADMLPKEQLSKGYTMQSFFIGLGAVLAAFLPWLLLNVFGFDKTSTDGSIPGYVKISFLVGAFSFFGAMLYTVLTTREYPPEYFAEDAEEKIGYFAGLSHAFHNMPRSFVQLAPVQFFTWLGLFLMWFYLTVTVTEHVFGATDPNSSKYADGLAWANICFGFYSVVTFIFALAMPAIAHKIGKKMLHFFCLAVGGAALLSIYFIHDQYVLLLAMTGVGIAWASIVSMPYAMIAQDIPPRQMGIFMGLFNMFIVIPEIIAALGFGWVMRTLLDNNKLHAVMLGGGCLLLAALLTLLLVSGGDDPDVQA